MIPYLMIEHDDPGANVPADLRVLSDVLSYCSRYDLREAASDGPASQIFFLGGQFGVVVPRGVEKVGLRMKVLRQTCHWIFLLVL